MNERLDYYDILPEGMDAYLAAHGHHFSKPMLHWAVGMMRSRNGERIAVPEKSKLDEILAKNGITIENNKGYYDPLYVWCMSKSDYFGSSIPDEAHLALYVKDFLDDPDGSPTRAFDEFYAKTIALGIDIPWDELL